MLLLPLTYYHFGASASTAASYEGLDMRGEVVLLTRNVKIEGDPDDGPSFGMVVQVGDRREYDGTSRVAKFEIDNVELLRGGH
jgi:hypothetical protein